MWQFKFAQKAPAIVSYAGKKLSFPIDTPFAKVHILWGGHKNMTKFPSWWVDEKHNTWKISLICVASAEYMHLLNMVGC